MPQPTGLPAGVYVGLTMDDYHADPAIGSSGIKDLLLDPEEYYENSALNPDREEDKPTPAKVLGTAYHTLVLEPEKFKYQVKAGVKSSTVDGMIGEGDFTKLQAMRQRLARNPQHNALLSGGVPECSIFYRDLATGLMCKIRCDMFAPRWISDLKTSDDVTDKGLRYSFPDYGYDISGAMYSLAATEIKTMIRNGYKMPAQFSAKFVEDFMALDNQIFAFVYQAKKKPYTTRVWCVTPWLYDLGINKYRQGLEIYQRHQDVVGPWPSKHGGIEDVTEDMLSQSINYY